jgi:hypothetical protein
MQIYKFFNIKYITSNLLPIILLICAVISFHYSYLIENFDFAKIRKDIEDKREKKCKDAGYDNCFHKKKEDKCKKQKYKSCKHKDDEQLCKQKGYDSCKDKQNILTEIKDKRKTDEMISNSRQIELLGNNLANNI